MQFKNLKVLNYHSLDTELSKQDSQYFIFQRNYQRVAASIDDRDFKAAQTLIGEALQKFDEPYVSYFLILDYQCRMAINPHAKPKDFPELDPLLFYIFKHLEIQSSPQELKSFLRLSGAFDKMGTALNQFGKI